MNEHGQRFADQDQGWCGNGSEWVKPGARARAGE